MLISNAKILSFIFASNKGVEMMMQAQGPSAKNWHGQQINLLLIYVIYLIGPNMREPESFPHNSNFV